MEEVGPELGPAEQVGEALFEQKGNKMPKTQCHAMVQNDFKAHFQVPVYSLLPEHKMEEAVNYLAQRYQRGTTALGQLESARDV